MPSMKTSPTATPAPKAASARAAHSPAALKAKRSAKGSNIPVNAEQILSTGRTATGAASPGGTAASRHEAKVRHEAAQATPVGAESSEQRAARAQELVLAQLENIRRGIGEIEQLRANVQALTRKVEELAAAMASQGQAPGESATPVTPDRDGEPKRASGKGHVTWASRPAEPGGILDASSSVEEGSSVVGRKRDQVTPCRPAWPCKRRRRSHPAMRRSCRNSKTCPNVSPGPRPGVARESSGRTYHGRVAGSRPRVMRCVWYPGWNRPKPNDRNQGCLQSACCRYDISVGGHRRGSAPNGRRVRANASQSECLRGARTGQRSGQHPWG